MPSVQVRIDTVERKLASQIPMQTTSGSLGIGSCGKLQVGFEAQLPILK